MDFHAVLIACRSYRPDTVPQMKVFNAVRENKNGPHSLPIIGYADL